MTQFTYGRVAFLLSALLFAPESKTATLQPAALQGWESYVEAANARMTDRAANGQTFLWIDENAARLAKVKAGGIVLSQIAPKHAKRLPSALIHDWMGAVFIPKSKMSDVLNILRTYGRYQEFYRPNVADSKATVTGKTKDPLSKDSAPAEDRFSMILLNKAYFVNTAFETAYKVKYVGVTTGSGYSVSQSTRIQQIDKFGATGQHMLAVGEGSGIIWRLFSMMRFVERDGGVYLELEAMGLSRNIPGSIRFIIEPMVRKALRSSLSTTLRQTEEAVRASKEPTIRNTETGGL